MKRAILGGLAACALSLAGLAVPGIAHAAPASAASTGGFPSSGLPFAIQTTVNGQPRCLTRPAGSLANAPYPEFEPCSVLDLQPRQQWYQKSVDAKGYGIVKDSEGDCILGTPRLYPASVCAKLTPAVAAGASWKQLPDGLVANEKNGNYWGVTGSALEHPQLTGTKNPGTAAPFSLLVLDLLP